MILKNTLGVAALFLLLSSSTCNKSPFGYKYDQGSLPTNPVNLTDFNTKYDDYNSTAPSLGFLIPFCFSTNRNSIGDNFDIIYKPMNVNFDKSTGELKVTDEYDNWSVYSDDYQIIETGLNKIATDGNEYGPNLIVEQDLNRYNFTLMYSTDLTGNSQVRYTSNHTDIYFSEPVEVKFLNTDFDDMYPTFNNDRSRIYFCSNRDSSDFDIYYAIVNPELELEILLADEKEYEIIMDTILSGSSDDKCPFIFDDILVFTSDRSGGYGGFDLYYSILESGDWSEPINFGYKINTEYDEYRPVLINEGVSQSQLMMVFSSNRPGGAGGFDLYFVGIDYFGKSKYVN